MKVVCHFLFLNVVAVLLGWMVVADLPSRLYITVESNSPMNLACDSGRGCSFAGQGTQTSHLWLPMNTDLGRITIRKIAGDGAFRPVGARLWQHLVWEREWTPSEIETNAHGSFILAKESASVGLSKIAIIGLVGSEIVIVLMAFVFAWLSHFLPRGTQRTKIDLVVAAISLAFFCAGIIPMQTYLANHIEMDLSLGSVLLDLAVRFVVIFAIAAILLFWSARFASSFYLVLLSSVLLYIYLETGILSFDYPSFTGDMQFFKNIPRMVWDTAVLPTSFLALFFLHRSLPSVMRYLPPAIVVMGLASLCDVKRSDLPSKIESEIISEFKPKEQVLREVVYSSKRNVLMYVLDSMATPVLMDVFKHEPRFAEELTGFVCYTNNLGMYNKTVTGVAGMSTGRYFTDTSKLADYMRSTFSQDSFLTSYLHSDVAVFVNPGMLESGVSIGNKQACAVCEIDDAAHSLRKRMSGQQLWNLAEIVRFRMVPFGLKYVDYVLTAAGWPALNRKCTDLESIAYPELAEAPIDKSLDLALHVWHTFGPHPPFDINRHGINDGVIRDDYTAVFEKTWYVWKQLSLLLARLKARGLYDNSMIVITADHGRELPGDRFGHAITDGRISSRALPILLVKAARDAGGGARFSSAPTSHARIHDLMTTAASKDLTSDEISSILKCSNRCFSIPGDGQFENLYLSAGNKPAIRNVKSTGKDPLDQVIKLNHSYSLSGNNQSDIPPVKFTGFYYASLNGPFDAAPLKMPGCHDGRLVFKVPDVFSRYCVRLMVTPREGTRIVDVGSKNNVLIAGEKRICEIDVCPNERGLVTLNFYLADFVSLHSIEVTCIGK